jgi:hypothetical protein
MHSRMMVFSTSPPSPFPPLTHIVFYKRLQLLHLVRRELVGVRDLNARLSGIVLHLHVQTESLCEIIFKSEKAKGCC